MRTRLDHLMIGPVAPLGAPRVASGIDKRSVSGPLWLAEEGFIGDAQGDRKHHGGPEKAVHHYAFDHYAPWRAEIGDKEVLRQPGAFGENFSTIGLDESTIAVGDVFRAGGALLEVSQGRQPCWKLNLRFDVADMALRVQSSGRTGWYYRVIEPGFVASGDQLSLIERRSPQWTLQRLWRALYVDMLNPDELAAIAILPSLAPNWRRHAQRRLATRKVEDQSSRLNGGGAA